MFGKLKEKLKSWFKKSEESIEKPEEIATKPDEKPEKPSDKDKKIKEKRIKKDISTKALEHEKKRAEEHKDEREISVKIEKDIEDEQEKREKTQLEEKPEKKQGFLSKLFHKMRFHVTDEYFNGIFSDLEVILLENNVAYEVVEKIKKNLKENLVGKEIEKNKVETEIKNALRSSIESILMDPFDIIEKIKEKNKSGEPFVIIFFGINGTGKTTTIAKTASMLKAKGFSVVLAAADTFRAASIEQLSHHASKLGLEVIKSQYNADPASVGFDAIKHAKSRHIDVVLIDTAGRMHTKESLMKEMEKIVRVTKPDLKIFLGESITGNDAVEQAKTFNESVGIDGIILSKADVDDKGGAALSVSYITQKPILFLGTGQEYKDLKPFKKQDLIESLGL